MSHVTTLAERLEEVLDSRFVGRRGELQRLQDWLDEGPSPFAAVVAPGGYGKTWLLRRFVRDTVQAGREVRQVDLSLHGDSLSTALDAVLDQDAQIAPGALVVVDGAEHAQAVLNGLMDHLLSTSSADTRVLLGTRRDPRSSSAPWAPAVQVINLAGFNPTERDECLRAQGVTDPGVRLRIASRVGGHPLALALAGDLSAEIVTERGRTTRVWSRGLRALVEQFLRSDAVPGDLVEAAAVVNRLDEALLAAMMGEQHAGDFELLCDLAFVVSADGGLALHESIRPLVRDYARWRSPDRLRSWTNRALEHLLSRTTSTGLGTAVERPMLEAVDLLADQVGLTALGYQVHEEGMRVEQLSSTDLAAAIASQGFDPFTPRAGLRRESIEDLLAFPGASVNVAYDVSGRMRGYGVVAPLSEQALASLRPSSRLWRALPVVLRETGLDRAPATADASNLWVYSQGAAPMNDVAARAALFRTLMATFLLGGAYLTFADPDMARQFDQFDRSWYGERLFALPENELEGAQHMAFADLSRSTWSERLVAVAAGRAFRSLGDDREIASSVAAAVAAWHDDEDLAGSSIADVVASHHADRAGRADAVRGALRHALSGGHRSPSLPDRLRRALQEVSVTALPPVERAPAAESPTSVRLQGRFAIERGGLELSVGQGVLAAAVKIVALHGALPTDELLEQLWPEGEPAAGRVRLRTTLARIRREAPGLLARDGDTIRLASSVTTDLGEFLQLGRAALAATVTEDRGYLLRTALDAYGGELLPTDRYAEWAVSPREAQQRMVLGLLDALIGEALASDDIEAACAYYEQASALDAANELRAERVVRAALASGRLSTAAVILKATAHAISELGVRPSPRLVELAAQIRGSMSR